MTIPEQSSSPGGQGRPDADDLVLRFVERLALVLTESGMQRMAARVFAYLLASQDDRHTAAELARGLRVSPAAISGAVRYLAQAQLIIREREPGARSDAYRLHDDIWSETYLQRLGQVRRWEQEIARGIDELGAAGRPVARLEESRAFLAFLQDELPRLIDRWREHRRTVLGAGSAGA